MGSPHTEVTGYAVTLEVFVPADVAEGVADRLDAAWHNESWTPEAAAFAAAQEVLTAAGLGPVTSVSTREVTA
jgi:hypothetical protein